MSANGHAMATITETEWMRTTGRIDDLETGQGRILAEAAAARKAAESAERVAKSVYEKVALFDGKLSELVRDQRRTNRRVESFEDLSEAKEKSDLLLENSRLKSLPRRVMKWAGLVLGVCAAAAELAHRIGWLK